MGALCVLIHFVVSGEMLVRHSKWATFTDQPLSLAISTVSLLVVLIFSSAATWLHLDGKKARDRFLRSLKERALLDNGVRQDEQGRDVRPEGPASTLRGQAAALILLLWGFLAVFAGGASSSQQLAIVSALRSSRQDKPPQE